MLREFRDFLEKFNVVPAAIGLVLALAFTPLVDSVVALVLSIVGRIVGLSPDMNGVYNFGNWTPYGFPVGDVVNAGVTFVLIAFIVFIIIKALASAGAKTELAPTREQALLTEIRDLLANR